MERLNITLDDMHAEKLTCLAQRMHVQAEAVACLLLSSALDETDPDAGNVAELLDAIPGAFERAHLGLEQATVRQTISSDLL